MQNLNEDIDNIDIIKAIELDKNATKNITLINELIWETTNKIESETRDKWNLSYLLHHEIIRFFSQVISVKYGYGKPSFEHLKNSTKLFFEKKINPIYYSSFFHHEYKSVSKCSSLLKYFLNFFFNFKKSKKSFIEVYVYSPQLQVYYLKELFHSISNLISEITNNQEYIFEDFLKFYKLKICTVSQFNLYKFPKILLVGSRLLFFNRYLLCMCRKANSLVITSTHSHASIFYHDINWYYGDFTGGNIQYEYGISKIIPHKINSYTVKKRIFRSSKVIRNLIKMSTIKEKNLQNSKRVLYTPTLLSGKDIYFPKRQYPDQAYIKHWDFILESSNFIDICLHPKSGQSTPSPELVNFKKKWGKRIVKLSLYEYLISNFYKTFIVDHISTTSTEILASRKNLIYLDINLRDMDLTYFNSFSQVAHIINYKDFYLKSSILKEKISLINQNNLKDNYKNIETDKYSVF